MKRLSVEMTETLGPGFHSDGYNLFLKIRETGHKTWVFRYKKNRKQIAITIGPLSKINLTQARKVATRMRAATQDGISPKFEIRTFENERLFEQAKTILKKLKAGGFFKELDMTLKELIG